MKCIIWKSKKNNQWYFTIKSSNGKIVVQSEGYKRRASAVKTAKRLPSILKNLTYHIL